MHLLICCVSWVTTSIWILVVMDSVFSFAASQEKDAQDKALEGLNEDLKCARKALEERDVAVEVQANTLAQLQETTAMLTSSNNDMCDELVSKASELVSRHILLLELPSL